MQPFRKLLAWLGLERPAGVGLRPHAEFEMPCSLIEAHARCADALTTVAGATIQSDDERTIEAGFGIVNSERLRVRLEPIDVRVTRVRIEAIYTARLAPPPRSMAVDALTGALADDVGP